MEEITEYVKRNYPILDMPYGYQLIYNEFMKTPAQSLEESCKKACDILTQLGIIIFKSRPDKIEFEMEEVEGF